MPGKLQSSTDGITIVEMIVSITLSSIILLSLIPLIINMFSVGSAFTKSAKQINDVQNAISMIEFDLTRTNALADVAPYTDTATPRTSASNTWRASPSDSPLILKLPATTKSYQSPDRQLVFDADTGSCEVNGSSSDAQPVFVYIIYFIHQNTLYRRTLPPSTYNSCGTRSVDQQKSCLPMSLCSSNDIVVLENISSIDFSYYLNPDSSDPLAASSFTPGVLEGTPYRGIEITIKSTVNIDNKDSVHELTLRDSI